jgi:hypothetical protein
MLYKNGHLIFKEAADSDIFNQKLAEARNLKTEFFRAYGQMRHTQQVMAAQLGLQGTEFDRDSFGTRGYVDIDRFPVINMGSGFNRRSCREGGDP